MQKASTIKALKGLVKQKLIIILLQMNIKSQHEVYIELKMFQSIGFHHQGNYSIMMQCYDLSGKGKTKELAVPFGKAKRFQEQQSENECGRVNIKKLQYESARFDVSFNEQQIIFNNNYCIFKLQHLIQNPQDCKKEIYLQLKLIKHNSHKNSDQSGETEENPKNMCSTDNVIKVTMDEAAEEAQSNKKNCLSQLKIRKQKPQEVVSIAVMTISTDGQTICNPSSIYQSIIFSDHQYFGKLFFTILHTKLGYKIRKIQETLTSYVIQKLDSIEKSRKKDRKKKNQKANQYLIQNPVNLLKIIFPDAYTYFQTFLVHQLKCFHQLEQLQVDIEQQNLSNSIKLNQQKNGWKVEKYPVISCPDTEILHNTQSLIEFYQASSLENLYLIIYQQMVAVTTLIHQKLAKIRKNILKIKWSLTYFAKYNQNIKFEVGTIYKIKVSELNALQVYQKMIPNLKYRYYIHEDVPNFYIRKKGKYTNSFGKVSDQHTLFVMVHGFNGNEFDMNRIKSFISFFSTPYFLIIRNITSRIYQSLDTLGEIAAQEINEFLKLKPFIKKINFIGYSLGGIIIRSSLRYLKKYHNLFNLFITLSSPHLGVKQTQSCMVRTGLYYLSHFRGAVNIKQFLLEPEQARSSFYEQKQQKSNQLKEVEDQMCYLEKLSKDPLIGNFELAIFFGSENDKYVPGSSATLDYSGPCPTINRMQDNLLRSIKSLEQIYVKFDDKKKGSYWDHLTGRRIHINFLDYDPFLYFLSAQYYDIF